MSTRPEILFPLFAEITKLAGVGPKLAKHFETLGVTKPRDLLFTLPHSGINRNIRNSIREIEAPDVATVEVEVGMHQPNAVKGRPYRVNVEDAQTSFQLVFFHARADYLRRLLPTGQRRIVSGKVEIFDNVAQMVHPDHVLALDEAESIPAFEPVYPLSAGLSQKVMRKAALDALARAPKLAEWIEPSLKAAQGWPDWNPAIDAAHNPQSGAETSPRTPTRMRLAYDEMFAHQLTLALARAKIRRGKGIASVATGKIQSKVLKNLPYRPTDAQDRAIREIADDLASPLRMNRLLQGDVGSGKTLVALMALLCVVEAGGQGVMMAPTEILARQHLESLRPMMENAGVVMELLTGRDKGGERAAKLKALAQGDIQILLGTHAVFQKDVDFNDLRLAVIDEQHRFGVQQRMDLGQKGRAVDILVMTATPIPRSLQLAQYGDMDVSVLDEKPPGRKPIKTVALPNGRINEVISHLEAAIAAGRQAYWVCPLVSESETVDWTAAAERFRSLRLALGEDAVGLVHGQMPAAEKDAAMAAFVAGETKVLVATTVIEVGVDVPNASIMVIERAENFGLAQLHQLRGRVGRGSQASSCLMVYAPPLGQAAEQRLNAMRESEDGFILAEIDLKLRGAGDVLGVAQSGLPRFKIADLETQPDVMAMAQDDARMLLGTDPDLTSARGRAARVLLWLMERDQSIRLISIG
ncbi:MAG: ATP-dependent DNA helicase RecG [Alphaproteobacteria bacterium]|nr:ATP-dependent DNA helicase RecG [Alphaproteobacteria bacterium]